MHFASVLDFVQYHYISLWILAAWVGGSIGRIAITKKD